MQEINTNITIEAPIEKVWKVLTDFSTYSAWNPFLTEIKGRLNLNERLHVTINPPDQKPMTFKPRIIALKEYEFHWVGRLLMPGLFDGRHSFCLMSLSENEVLFKHSEIFSGWLHKPILKLIRSSTQKGFEEMNASLKRYCEN